MGDDKLGATLRAIQGDTTSLDYTSSARNYLQ